jgi:hypothetical protein
MARYHEGKDRLEFFAGAERLPKDPPVWDFETEAGDLLLLCSDGVNGEITEDQITTILSDATLDSEQKADALIQAALDAGETDNQTLILWQVGAVDGTAEPGDQQAASELPAEAQELDEPRVGTEKAPASATEPPEASDGDT